MTSLSPIPMPQVAQVEADPVIRLATLWRGRGRILLTVLLMLALGAVYSYRLAVPIYRTHVTIMLEPQEQTVIDLGRVLPGLGRDEQILNTQTEVLRSRTLVGRLVDRLQLIEDPEFNASLRPPPTLSPRRWAQDLLAYAGLAKPYEMPDPTQAQMRDGTINAVIRSLDVTISAESLILLVAIGTTDATKSARIVNELADIYVADQLEAKLAATDQATVWLTGRVIELKHDFEQADALARSARAELGLHSPKQVKELERRLEATRLRLDAHSLSPAVRQALRSEAAGLTEEIRIATEGLVRIDQLERDADATGLLYESFLTRLKETSVQSGVHQPDARIISAAVVPLFPARPKPAVVLSLCLVLGAAFGALWVLAREEWGMRVRSTAEAERIAGLPVIATLPEDQGKRSDPLADMAHHRSTALTEAIDSLRGAVLLSNLDRPPKVVAVTSSVAGEGKTTHAMMLAQSFASWGHSVLLIEADIRAPAMANRLGAKPRKGLLSVVAGLSSFDEVVFRPAGTGMDVLLAEPSVVHISDVLGTRKFAEFLQTMRARYDHIVIDTPPTLETTEARVIATRSDAVLYLLRWNKTTRAEVRQGLATFRRAGIALSGVVLSRTNLKRARRYGYQSG